MSDACDQMAEHLLLSNGYPSLVSRLRRDSTVKSMATKASTTLKRNLKASIANEPVELGEHVRPYAILTAMYLKQDRKALEYAARLSPNVKFPWYQFIVAFLLEKLAVSNSFVSIKAPVSATASGKSNVSSGSIKVTQP